MNNSMYEKYTGHKKQNGSGGCSLCGTSGVNKSTCPLNKNSKKPLPDKHITLNVFEKLLVENITTSTNTPITSNDNHSVSPVSVSPVSVVASGNYKSIIVRTYKLLLSIIQAKSEKNAINRIRVHSNTLQLISDYNGVIDNMETVRKLLTESGKKNPISTIKNIEEIINTGTLSEIELSINNPLIKAYMNLSQIHGIGPSKVKKIYETYNITEINQLKKLTETNNKILTKSQSVGLKYIDDLQKRIPYNEVEIYEETLKKIAHEFDNDMQLSINGSYRRKSTTSGDIDVLITGTNNLHNFIKFLFHKGILIDTFSNGTSKFMGISKLPGFENYRHIDIIQTSKEEYPFAVVYFTGSGGFNTMMRGTALCKGYSLNEKCISNKNTKVCVTPEEINSKLGKSIIETEQDIFKFLDMEYVLPEHRDKITLSKLY